MKKYAVKIGRWSFAFLFWIAVWYVIAFAVDVEMIIPFPHRVFTVLANMLISAEFWISTLSSLMRVLLGIFISVCLGVIIAYLMSVSNLVNTILSPMISVIKATPVASFIVIAFLWFSTSALPTFIATLVVIPIIVANISQGISSVNPELKDVGRVFHFSALKKLRLIYIPSIFPFFLAACNASLGMAWKASVAAELIVATRRSIGEALYYGKQNFEADSIFAWTIIIVLLSVVSEKLSILILNFIGKKVSFMRREGGHASN